MSQGLTWGYDVEGMRRLLDVMARLRDPASGCPWDLSQDFASVAPYTVEEGYEVADAAGRGDMAALRDELGDLLFQVVFHARMAEERGAFDFEQVADMAADKLVRRHPHVFGGPGEGHSAEGWERQKAAERAHRASREGRPASLMDGVARALPALWRAVKVQRRAARGGFDWNEAGPAMDKVGEELSELRGALADHGPGAQRVEEELGDLLFACANAARHAGVDPERALAAASDKFERRFRRLESAVGEGGQSVAGLSLDALDAIWERIKQEDGAATGTAAGAAPPPVPDTGKQG